MLWLHYEAPFQYKFQVYFKMVSRYFTHCIIKDPRFTVVTNQMLIQLLSDSLKFPAISAGMLAPLNIDFSWWTVVTELINLQDQYLNACFELLPKWYIRMWYFLYNSNLFGSLKFRNTRSEELAIYLFMTLYKE